LPNVGPYIYDVSISGFTRSSIYIYDISSLSVNLETHIAKLFIMRSAAVSISSHPLGLNTSNKP